MGWHAIKINQSFIYLLCYILLAKVFVKQFYFLWNSKESLTNIVNCTLMKPKIKLFLLGKFQFIYIFKYLTFIGSVEMLIFQERKKDIKYFHFGLFLFRLQLLLPEILKEPKHLLMSLKHQKHLVAMKTWPGNQLLVIFFFFKFLSWPFSFFFFFFFF